MKKVFLLLFMLLGMMSLANAALTDNNVFYYSFDNETVTGTTVTDLSSAGNDGTKFPSSSNPSQTGITKLGTGAILHPGTVEGYVDSGATLIPATGDWTYTAWVNMTDCGANNLVFLSQYDGGATGRFTCRLRPSSNDLSCEWNGGSNSGLPAVTCNQEWKFIAVQVKGTQFQGWLNNVLLWNVTRSGSIYQGETTGISENWNSSGIIDEASLWQRGLNFSELEELYNSGVGFNPYTVAVNVTPTIQSDLEIIYNVSNITVNLNTTDGNTTDMSYVLDGGSEISICSTCSTGQVNLTVNESGLHNVTWVSRKFGTSVNTTEFFLVDLNPPNLTVSLPAEYNFYTGFNFSNYINASDNVSNVTCIVVVGGETNTTCSNNNYDFTTNGNKSISVFAFDDANNFAVSLNNTMLINPFQYLNFQTDNGTPITNYTLSGRSWNDTATYKTYNDNVSIGNNTLLFEKFGFATTQINFSLNLTSQLNETFNVTESQINIQIFDRATGSLLTGLTSLTGVATQGFTANTTTGLVSVTNINFLSETYQVIAEHSGYASEQVFFEYDNQEILNLDIYMLNLTDPNFGLLTIRTVTSNSELIPNAQCDLQEWFPSLSSFVSVAQGLTDTQGEFTFNVELDVKVYKVLCSKGGVTSSSLPTEGGIISVSGTIFPIIMDDPTIFIESRLKNFAYSFTNSTETNTTDRLTFTFNDDDGLVTEACVKIYHGSGFSQTLNSSTCVSGSSGEIQVIVNINETFDITAQATVETADGVIENLKQIIYEGSGTLGNLLLRYNLDKILPIMLVIGFIALGLNMQPQNIYISVLGSILAVWFSFILIPSTISLSIAIIVQVIGTVMLLWGATR